MARALVCARVQYTRYDQRRRVVAFSRNNLPSKVSFIYAQLCRGARSERVRAMGTRVVCRVRPPSCRAAVPSPVSSRAESSEILVASPAYSPSVSPGGAGAGGSPPPSSSPTQTHAFVFDGVFDGGATDDDVSRACLDPALHDVCVRGINATVMAYGQSGAGKTHTMEGGARGVDGKGLIPRASELFSNPSLSSPLPSLRLTPWHRRPHGTSRIHQRRLSRTSQPSART